MADLPATNSKSGSTRVFISWSGARSKILAQAIKDWLPLVLHYVEPWMSQANIEAGDRWSIAVAKELEVSNFGIICVTRENMSSPWVLFESGALAKSMQDSRVVPLLLDLDFQDISGPLAQFQAKKVEKSGLGEVIQSINNASGQAVPDDRAKQLFDALWKQLEDKVAAIPKPAAPAKPTRTTNEVIEELVAGVRAIETRIRDLDDTPKSPSRRKMRFHPMMFEEIMQMSGDPGDPVGILMAASMMREDAPWLYELAMEVYKAVRTGDLDVIERESRRLQRFSEMSMRGPWMRELGDKDSHILMMEFPRMLENMLKRTLARRLSPDEKRVDSAKILP